MEVSRGTEEVVVVTVVTTTTSGSYRSSTGGRKYKSKLADRYKDR